MWFVSVHTKYTRCTLKEKPVLSLTQTQSLPPISHLQYLQSKIELHVLKHFEECFIKNVLPNEITFVKLYDVWAKFKKDSLLATPMEVEQIEENIDTKDNYLTGNNIVAENIMFSEDNEIIEFPFPEWSMQDLEKNTECN